MTDQLTKETTRTRRSRVVLLGASDHAAQLASEFLGNAVRVSNAYEAIGEVTTAPVREPVEAVVLSESALDGISEHPAHAMRRLDPSVRIFLVKDAPADGSVPRTAADHQFYDGFDAVLQDWPSAEQLSRLLGRESSGDLGECEIEVTRDDPSRRSAAAEEVATGRDGPMPGGPVPRHDSSKESQSELSSELGDIDLVEAVLESESGVRGRAIELIRQHTGWHDVALVEREHDNEPSSEGVVVAVGDRTFGRLVSKSSGSREKLTPWAHWLAKWLALDADHRQFRQWSFRDDLTGAWNRRYFMQFLTDAIKTGMKKRLPVTLMIFDLDDFKRYNDEFGHAAGDEILRETVQLLNSVIRKSDRVCRIGGDEFAVIFTDPGGPREKGSMPPETVEQLAQRFQMQVCNMRFPKLGIEAPGTLSVSAGLATFPWDAWDPKALIEHADQLALESKRKGKNAITLGQGARHVCEPSE